MTGHGVPRTQVPVGNAVMVEDMQTSSDAERNDRRLDCGEVCRTIGGRLEKEVREREAWERIGKMVM